MMLMRRNGKNPLLYTLKHVSGNQKATLFLQPLFGIPYNLYIPFAALFMSKVGLNNFEIGVIATLNLLSQMLSSIFAGVLADKLGRRKCLFIADIIAWVVPCLLWSLADSYPIFIIAALLNGVWRISSVSFNLILVEGAPKEKWIHLYSLNNIAGLLAGFISPFAFLIVKSRGLIPTMRALYFISFLMMVFKNSAMYLWTKDTDIAKRRLEESKKTSIMKSLFASRRLLLKMLRSKNILLSIGIMSCFLATKNIYDNFWPLFVTNSLSMADESLSIFNMTRASVMVLFSLFVLPGMAKFSFKRPMLTALTMVFLSNVLYLIIPAGNMILVVLLSLLDAFALAILIPVVANIDASQLEDEDRAKMSSFTATISLIITAPFGLFSGYLSRINTALPLVLILVFTMLSALMTLALHNLNIRKEHKI